MSMKNVSNMKKNELQQELDEWEVIYSSTDTVKELRSILTKTRQDKVLTKSPTETDPIAGLASLKRTELVQKCKELTITLTGNETCGSMITLIKKHFALTSEPNGNDVYNIGRYQGMTYRQIRTQYLEYSEWVKTTLRESGDSCHWELKRFGRYLNRALSPEPTPLTPMVKKERTTNPTLKVEIQELKEQVKDLDQRLRQNTAKRGSASTDPMGIDQSNALTDGTDHVLRAILQRLENLETRDLQSNGSASWTEVKEPKD
jgi:hypothetical protein